MFKTPEKYRYHHPNFPEGEKNKTGCFKIPLFGKHKIATAIASSGEGWEHVSVTVHRRKQLLTPTWKEMCFIKKKFWEDDDCVIQYHPAAAEYVNNHPNCLHLWRPINLEIPIPPSILVGIQGLEINV